MIFINTRPVDENAHCEDRRASKTTNHSGNGGGHGSNSMQENGGSEHVLRLSLILMIFYVLVSIFPAILFYPVSLLAMVVPILALFFALCSIRHLQHINTQWPVLFIAVIGILLKIAAIVLYITLFPIKDSRRRGIFNAKSENELHHYRTVFYVILTAIEFFIMMVGICLKSQLVALQKRENIQKRRSISRSLMGENDIRAP
ncbi:unnamed protein product [Caenorhabditis angaria]|uniref:Uncharacterized protein n=1 Tax=Caenorhabditis angaria TaxID=860376 RepID=A0A9P1N678_9PELO|nr:unnamed protein product [Caenorhabditis angaria]